MMIPIGYFCKNENDGSIATDVKFSPEIDIYDTMIYATIMSNGHLVTYLIMK